MTPEPSLECLEFVRDEAASRTHAADAGFAGVGRFGS
jgi:hypothetical protein